MDFNAWGTETFKEGPVILLTVSYRGKVVHGNDVSA